MSRSVLSALAVIAAAMASPVQAKPVYVECLLDSSAGKPIPWRITLDEENGTADVTLGDREPVRLRATFFPDKVQFYFGPPGHMRMELSRVDLTISRYSYGEDAPPNTAQCKLAALPKTKF